MNDKEALQEVIYMTNEYVNTPEILNYEFIIKLITFLEENVIHCSMDNDYK